MAAAYHVNREAGKMENKMLALKLEKLHQRMRHKGLLNISSLNKLSHLVTGVTGRGTESLILSIHNDAVVQKTA